MSQIESSGSQLEHIGKSAAQARYSYNKLQQGDKTYFVKQALSPDILPLLSRELLWHDFMSDVSDEFPDLHVGSPEIHSLKGDTITFEYIDSPYVADDNNIQSLKPKIPRLVNLLLAMDSVGENWTSPRPVEESSNHAPYWQIDSRWSKWAEKPLESGILTQDILQEAHKIVDSHKKFLTPRMQHGDFVPWHIFERDDEWLIYDGEHASTQKPRFYDLAYLYTRLFTRAQSPEIAAEILTGFVDQIDLSQEQFFNAFWPVVTSRSIGMFLDAHNDKPHNDYVKETKELFKKCRQGKLSAFTTV
jgi:hypothetical protein